MSVPIAGFSIAGLGNLPAHAGLSYQYLLVRLLLGTASVERAGSIIKQRLDYSALPASPQVSRASIAVRTFLVDYAIGGSVKRLIKVTIPDNRIFYKELLNEFAHFIYQQNKGCFTTAFVFLYRIFERISFSVPLLYTSTQKDYIGTFNALKGILNADTSGEMALFKKFLSQGKFIDPLKLNVNLSLSFKSSFGHQDKYYVLTTKKVTCLTSPDPINRTADIKFSDVPELLKAIRNRFFHSRTGDGKDNIFIEEMPDSDEYFECINQTIANFLSIVTLQTIAAKYQL